MARRPINPFRLLPAVFALALAALSLSAAPILSELAEARPHAAAMAAMSAGPGAPCAAMADKADHMGNKHAQNCLARCLTAQGAMVPDLPGLKPDRLRPVEPLTIPAVRVMRALASGIDPPPPRQS